MRNGSFDVVIDKDKKHVFIFCDTPNIKFEVSPEFFRFGRIVKFYQEIGDFYNDLEFLKKVGVAVAMKNAIAERYFVNILFYSEDKVIYTPENTIFPSYIRKERGFKFMRNFMKYQTSIRTKNNAKNLISMIII